MTGTRIYLSPPHMSERERDLLIAAFDSNWIAPDGHALPEFERELKMWFGRRHAVALSSGTAALHLALLSLGVGPSDEVLVPTMTFAATANAVVYTGARPVFVDCESSTMGIDPELLRQGLQERAAMGRLPKAVIAVDLYGQAARYEEIEPICDEYGVALIEDAAEGLGASRYGRPCGSFGVLAAGSFNGNKIATTGGGGVLAGDDGAMLAHVRYLATQARQPVAHYEHEHVGYNYRLSNLLAAVGSGQLAWLSERIEAKRRIRDRYIDAFQDLSGVLISPIDPANSSNYWLTTVLIDPDVAETTPNDVRLGLERHNIESRPMWKPMHRQPVYRDATSILNGTADRLFQIGLCLPSGSSLVPREQDRVIAALREAVQPAVAA